MRTANKFDARLLSCFLGGILVDNLGGVLLYRCNQTVVIVEVTSFVVEGSDDHFFASGVPALEDDHGLIGLSF